MDTCVQSLVDASSLHCKVDTTGDGIHRFSAFYLSTSSIIIIIMRVMNSHPQQAICKSINMSKSSDTQQELLLAL